MKKNNRYRKQIRRKKTNAEKKAQYKQYTLETPNINTTKMEGEHMNNILPNTKCAVLQSSLNATEYSKGKAVAGKIRIFMDVMHTFAKVPVNSVRIQLDASKVVEREHLLNDFTEFCTNLFKNAQTYKFCGCSAFNVRIQRRYQSKNVKVNGDELALSMNEEFNAEELLGIDLEKIRSVKIIMPTIYDEKLLKYTHLVVFCFMSYHLMYEDSVQDINILCKNWEFVQQLNNLSTEDVPLPSFFAEEVKDADGNFIGVKLFSLPEEGFERAA